MGEYCPRSGPDTTHPVHGPDTTCILTKKKNKKKIANFNLPMFNPHRAIVNMDPTLSMKDFQGFKSSG